MEPDAINHLPDGYNAKDAPVEIAMASIAISLKRIADALNYQPVGSENLFDYIRKVAEKNG